MISGYIKPYLYFKNTLDNFINESGTHENWTMIILTSGSFSVTMQKKKEIISKNDIVIFPAHMYFKRKVIDKISYYCVQFDINKSSAEAFTLPFGKAHVADKKRLFHNLQILDRFLNQHDTFAENIKLHILFDVLYQITLESHRADEFKVPDTGISNVVEYIEKNFDRTISLKDIASSLCITTSGLIYRFKKYTGLTPLEYIINLRISKAKFLLIQTEFSINEIAEQCGYENMYYFSNAFKKVTGVAPSAFRTKNSL